MKAAIGLHKAGRLHEAEAIYRRVLAEHPKIPDALNLLGVIAGQTGRNAAAIELIQAAIAIAPATADYHTNLGHAFMAARMPEKAAGAFEEALRLHPGDAEMLLNLARSRCDSDKFAEAIDAYRAALKMQPRRADLLTSLAIALRKVGQVDESLEIFQQALALERRRAEIWLEQGISLGMAGRLNDAVDSFQRAVQLSPDDANIYYNLGTALYKLNRPDEAIVALQRAVAICPGNLTPYNNLANALRSAGRLEEAIGILDRVLAMAPDDSAANSNRLYFLNFHPAYDTAALHREMKIWNDRVAAPLAKKIQPHGNDRSVDRRLRVGYLSPDFYRQAESHFTVPLLTSHDHAKFEIFCFAYPRTRDDVTERLRASADVWREMKDCGDEAFAERIRQDRIDILVDLTMHMGDNRLLVFAQKPAPIQVTWLAYPGSTGLAAMDYRLSDAWMDPPGDNLPYAEETLRLNKCWCCYDPLIELPFRQKRDPGPIRFASLNNPSKFNEATLVLWAELMRQVADSQLLLLCNSQSQAESIVAMMGRCGIDKARLRFMKPSPRWEYLERYNQIDIALDPLPYNGITTTCDALWMGVPVVSLAGRTAAGRAGLSILSVLGLPELAARDGAEFVRIAAALAHEERRLAELRSGLRAKMSQSPLMDAAGFARDVEAAYRMMWRKWAQS
ncbi:MAG TPA: tetratricopeptide repeat protein [Tepidisphaeraceae bacterium]|nr:tetratricopeptide repeat protein [Tepidisphaeraceae bacterium]